MDGCRKVTVSEHGVLHLVSCYQRTTWLYTLVHESHYIRLLRNCGLYHGMGTQQRWWLSKRCVCVCVWTLWCSRWRIMLGQLLNYAFHIMPKLCQWLCYINYAGILPLMVVYCTLALFKVLHFATLQRLWHHDRSQHGLLSAADFLILLQKMPSKKALFPAEFSLAALFQRDSFNLFVFCSFFLFPPFLSFFSFLLFAYLQSVFFSLSYRFVVFNGLAFGRYFIGAS